jgi:hypothetical protein
MLISLSWYAKNIFMAAVCSNASWDRTQFDILIGKARIIVLSAHIIHCALSRERKNEIE